MLSIFRFPPGCCLCALLILLCRLQAQAEFRVGVFTGTLNPPHLGHREAVEIAIEDLDLDHVYLIPSYDVAHKPGVLDYELRLNMARMLFSDHPKIHVPDADLEAVMAGSSTGELLDHLIELHSEDDFFQIMGSDAPARYSDGILEILNDGIHVAVNFRRGSSDEDKIPEEILNHPKFFRLSNPELATSSSEIRKALSDGKPHDQLTPEIMAFIDELRLYDAAEHLFCEAVLGIPTKQSGFRTN